MEDTINGILIQGIFEHGRTVMEGPARELLDTPHIRTAYWGL